jgi:hypothetical protein
MRRSIAGAGARLPGAVISHRSAASLPGFGKNAPAVVDLIPAEQGGREIDGIKVHRVPRPAPTELARVGGIPCTGAARTIVDLAGTYGEEGMREAVERAAAGKVPAIAEIDAILEAGPRRRGAPCLRRVVEDWRPVAESANFAGARSLFEVRLLPMVAAGHGCLRVTWREAEREPGAVLAAVRAELLRRGARVPG